MKPKELRDELLYLLYLKSLISEIAVERRVESCMDNLGAARFLLKAQLAQGRPVCGFLFEYASTLADSVDVLLSC